MTLPADSTDPFELPPPTPGRDYDEESPAPPVPLMPMAPRQKEMVESFKKLLALRIEEQASEEGFMTTKDFLEELALDLWRLTRKV